MVSSFCVSRTLARMRWGVSVDMVCSFLISGKQRSTGDDGVRSEIGTGAGDVFRDTAVDADRDAADQVANGPQL